MSEENEKILSKLVFGDSLQQTFAAARAEFFMLQKTPF